MDTMQRTITAQQTAMDALTTTVENNKREVLCTMDNKLTSLETQIHNEARTKEKIDEDRATKATEERAAAVATATKDRETAAHQFRTMMEFLNNLSSPLVTARPASPPPPTPTPPAPEAAPSTPPHPSPPDQAPALSSPAPTSLGAQAQDPPRLRAPTPINTFQPSRDPGRGR